MKREEHSYHDQVTLNTELNQLLENNKELILRLSSELTQVIEWLKDAEILYKNYTAARDRLKEAELLRKRKPQSPNFTQLNLDITPDISDRIINAKLAKREIYEKIRKSQTELKLQTEQRTEILEKGSRWGSLSHFNVPELQNILFPDLTFSLNAKELDNPDFPFPIDISKVLQNLQGLKNLIESRIKAWETGRHKKRVDEKSGEYIRPGQFLDGDPFLKNFGEE